MVKWLYVGIDLLFVVAMILSFVLTLESWRVIRGVEFAALFIATLVVYLREPWIR